MPSDADSTPNPETSASSTEEPIQFGQYLLQRRIGVGGFATVYEGELQGEYGFLKRVAVKVSTYRVASADDRVSAGFLNEARLGARIRHPNLVEFYECGRIGDRLYIAMELVDGPSLAQLLGVREELRTPLDDEAIAAIALDMARGLAGLHGTTARGESLGVVHRDLKPANVLLSTNGQVKISDYGVSRFDADFYTSLGKRGTLVGSPLYMSPELARGEEPAPASDIFSFGSVLLEMINGRPAFRDSSVSRILARVDRADVKAALEEGRRRMPALAPILETCLQPHRDDRYPDGDALVNALKELEHVRFGEEVIGRIASKAGELLDARHASIHRLPIAPFWETLGAEEEESVAIPWGDDPTWGPGAETAAEMDVALPRPRRLVVGLVGLVAVVVVGLLASLVAAPHFRRGDANLQVDGAALLSEAPVVPSGTEPGHVAVEAPVGAVPNPVEPAKRGDASMGGSAMVVTEPGEDEPPSGMRPLDAAAAPSLPDLHEAVRTDRVDGEDLAPESFHVRHEPVVRGLRGQPFRIEVAVSPPADYAIVAWYRAAPDGAWEALQFDGAAGGSVLVPAGNWQVPGCDEVEYFIEVKAPHGMERIGSPIDPFRFRLY